ncbi:MAG: hypothetical protein BroJett025_04240 [Patescibacteria group bacterium]|nr:MAG: hypothetical protein BroJett025_04240 [Patescibacteria group bacterium]
MKLHSVVVPLALTTTILFLAFTPISAVECSVDSTACPQDLQNTADSLKNKSFFFSNFEKELLKQQPTGLVYILESVSKKFPGTIQLTFKQEQVKYALLVAGEKKEVGDTGITLPAQSNETKIVIIEWKHDAVVLADNAVITEYHKIFLPVAETLSKSVVEHHRLIWNSDTEILLELEGQPLFIFDKQSIQTQIKKVDTIITAREIDEIEEPILEIDMRFDLPVLRTRQ